MIHALTKHLTDVRMVMYMRSFARQRQDTTALVMAITNTTEAAEPWETYGQVVAVL